MNKEQEYILCAAIWYNDGTMHIHQPTNIKLGFVVVGRRHHNCIQTFQKMVGGFPYNEEAIKLRLNAVQGFISSSDKFLTREEAFKLAIQAGQINELEASRESKILYSEDLY